MASPIRNISDTARWAAVYRADETERPDALFHDPFARKLAGTRGEEIRRSFSRRARVSWPWVARTVMFDTVIEREVASGIDLVVNLAAGLDARPYRMRLPASLRWVEVDLPDILDYKTEVLAGDRPVCALERVPLDLGDVGARRALFARLGAVAQRALVITEGLLVYLDDDEVRALGSDLAAAEAIRHWVVDLVSPGLLKKLQQDIGAKLDEAGAPLKFGPVDGPAFFAPQGWRAIDVQSFIKTAARIRRLPFFMWPVALFPEPPRPGKRPWGGVVLLDRS